MQVLIQSNKYGGFKCRRQHQSCVHSNSMITKSSTSYYTEGLISFFLSPGMHIIEKHKKLLKLQKSANQCNSTTNQPTTLTVKKVLVVICLKCFRHVLLPHDDL